MAIDYNVIGERLRKARISKRLTQEDLAEELKVSVAFLSRIERGSSHINLKRLTQLCALLDISEGYILTGSSSDSNSYLDKEFEDLLKNCSPEKQKMIYNVAKTIAESDLESNSNLDSSKEELQMDNDEADGNEIEITSEENS